MSRDAGVLVTGGAIRRIAQGFLAGTGVALVVLALASTASAALWLPPQQLSTDAVPVGSRAGVDQHGGATFAWYDLAESRIYARRLKQNGRLAPTLDLACGANVPSLAVAADGSAVATWMTCDEIAAVRILPDGTLQTPAPVSITSVGAAPRVAVDANGDALLTWIGGDFPGPLSVRSRRLSRTGELGPEHQVSEEGDISFFPVDSHLAGARDGTAVVGWVEARTIGNEARDTVQVRRLNPDGTPGPGIQLAVANAASERLSQVTVALDALGNVTATWTRDTPGGLIGEAGRLAANGTVPWTEVEVHDDISNIARMPIAPTTAGNVVVGIPIGQAVDAAVRRVSAGGGLGPLMLLNEGGDSGYTPDVAADAAGNAVAVFERFAIDTDAWQIGARPLPLNDPLGALTVVSGPGTAGPPAGDPVIALDDYGNGVASWVGTEDGQAARFARLIVEPRCEDTQASTPGTAVQVVMPCFAGITGWEIVGGPAHGSLGPVEQATGEVAYTPAAGFSGTDTFTFRAANALGLSNVATATITVSGSGPLPPPPGPTPPPPGPVPPPTPTPPVGGRATLNVTTNVARVDRGGRLRLRVRCRSTGRSRCAGVLRLQRPGGAADVRTVASTPVNVPHAARRTVSMRLTRTGRRVLRRARRLRVTAVARIRQPGQRGVRATRHRVILVAPAAPRPPFTG